MKHRIIVAIIIAALIGSWALGRAAGIRHAITTGEAWADDGIVFVEIDGQVHMYE